MGRFTVGCPSSPVPGMTDFQPLQSLYDLENSFDTAASIQWAQDHSDIPIFAVTAYFIVVFYVPNHLQTPFKLRYTWAVWNLLLAVFSIRGAWITVPHLINTIRAEGVRYTLCTPSQDWYLSGKVGFWVSMFIFSKIPELIDTVFLVLQKKPVIFLHWFHHVTVLLYCWHAYVHDVSPGMWFSCINYSVHSIMYFYYFCSIAGGVFKHVARPFAPLITTVQLLQMVVGSTVTAWAAWEKSNDDSCAAYASNLRLGLVMYTSYFVLFAILFYNLYLKPGGKHTKAGREAKDKSDGGKTRSGDDPSMCGVDLKKGDAAGFFHTVTRSATLKKKEN